MKVKNLFSSRKSKKKKNNQQVASSNDVTNNDKLIITKEPAALEKDAEKENGGHNSKTDDNKVVLRSKVKRDSLKNCDQCDAEKARKASLSSANSPKTRSSRRPWSFIEQMRRQESKESNSVSRSSLLVDDLISGAALPDKQEQRVLNQPCRSALVSTPPKKSGASTLPRSMVLDDSAGGLLPPTGDSYPNFRATLGQRESQVASATVQEHSKRPRTIDFRFFNFFKRSNSGDATSPSSHSESNSETLVSSGRGSFRGKNKNKKKNSKKKKEVTTIGPTDSITSSQGKDDLRLRSLSDGCDTSRLINPEQSVQRPIPEYCEVGIDSINDYVELDARDIVPDKRVPDNGEPAFSLEEGAGDSDATDSRPSSTQTLTSLHSTDLHLRTVGSSASKNDLNCELDQTRNLSAQCGLFRSGSSSTESSSRRSSFVCEPRDSPLPEGLVANFDRNKGARSKELYNRGSPEQESSGSQRVKKTLSSEANKEITHYHVEERCSKSVSNLALSSTLSTGSNSSTVQLPRSSSDADKSSENAKFLQPSLKQRKGVSLGQHTESAGAILDMVAPPSPVLRAIGYPSVVLRRHKHRRNKQRPSSAYADQRTQQVLSLNMEDLPTYSRLRHEMMRVNNGVSFPSYEDILAVREVRQPSNRASSGSASSGFQFASTVSSRVRRRGEMQRTSGGFHNAASVDDLDSLSSSYGSKQSLNEPRMDDDEILNAYLARASSQSSNALLRNQEPSSKRVKTIRKSVVSLANLISPGKPSKSSNKLQRSSSFKESGTAASSNTASAATFKPYRPPSNTPSKKNNRRSKLWCETFDHTGLSERQIKWQEAIFELYQGERDLVEDLTMAKQTYRDSMVTLKMLSDEEVTLIFGKLGRLLPLHEELLEKLEQARGEDGRTLAIGCIFVEWFPRISSAYREYCSNQSDAKYALDAAVERDARVRDFLQRCLESPFSRKLDLWSYLDLPRTRLVKYPLLLNNVLKRTPTDLEEERKNLDKVMEIIGEIIEQVDETTGEQQCRYIRSKLEYLDDKQRSHFVEQSRLMLLSGQLKNNRGTKMHVFLFEEALVLTRQATRSNKIAYQVYRHPLPLRSLIVDCSEGDKLSGSFRGGLLSSEKAKHSFRVRCEELNVTYTLQASEEHDRKQWINAIQDALTKYREKHPEACAPTAIEQNSLQSTRRRATYDPVQSVSSKKQAARAVLRSSSDKTNKTGLEKNLEEEFAEDDVTSASDEPLRRGRSQTVNPSLLTTKGPTLSRKSSSSSNKEEKTSKRKEKSNSAKDKKIERLQNEGDADGPPSPLHQGFKRSSVSRHFSLTGADRSIPVITRNNIEEVKRGNPCRRSRSLTSSPQIMKAVVSKFGNKKFSHSKTGSSLAISSGKPPIGPTASPYHLRRSPSCQAVGGIHEAQSTPNLLGFRRSSSRRSSGRQDSASENNSNSIGLLRKSSYGGSAMELRNLSQRVSEARSKRKVRSQGGSRNVSEGENPTAALVNSESVSTSLEPEVETIEQNKQKAEVSSDVGDAISVGSQAPAEEKNGQEFHAVITSAEMDCQVPSHSPDDVEMKELTDDAVAVNDNIADFEPAQSNSEPQKCMCNDVTAPELMNSSDVTSENDDVVVVNNDITDSVNCAQEKSMCDSDEVIAPELMNSSEVIQEFTGTQTTEPAEFATVDLISFPSDDNNQDDASLRTDVAFLLEEMLDQIVNTTLEQSEMPAACENQSEEDYSEEVDKKLQDADVETSQGKDLDEDVVDITIQESKHDNGVQDATTKTDGTEESSMDDKEQGITSNDSVIAVDISAMEYTSSSEEESVPSIVEEEEVSEKGDGDSPSVEDNNNICHTLQENDKIVYEAPVADQVCHGDTSLVTCRTEMTDDGVRSNLIMGQRHILNSNLQASV